MPGKQTEQQTSPPRTVLKGDDRLTEKWSSSFMSLPPSGGMTRAAPSIELLLFIFRFMRRFFYAATSGFTRPGHLSSARVGRVLLRRKPSSSVVPVGFALFFSVRSLSYSLLCRYWQFMKDWKCYKMENEVEGVSGTSRPTSVESTSPPPPPPSWSRGVQS